MTGIAITPQVEEYLVSRRAMGFELRGEGYQLHAFARFFGKQNEVATLTLELLLRWVHGPVSPGPVAAARRVEILRPFLKYCRQFDPSCSVIPLSLCGPGHRRLALHIHTDAEVTALLVAAGELKPDGLLPLTGMTFLGLLASTGMRLSEALRLKRKDLNLDQPSLTIHQTKFKKSRSLSPLLPALLLVCPAWRASVNREVHRREPHREELPAKTPARNRAG